MARDNRSKERQAQQLKRRENQRASYDRILIVSEGSKTEPNYFKEICAYHRLQSANIVVRPSELGTLPIQVVDYAKELFEKGDCHKRIPKRVFERVYAVFDRDDHPHYHDALARAESLDGKLRNDLKQPVVFQAIASIPCFELWLLLHFKSIQAPIERHEVTRLLKQYLPNYKKGDKGIFAATRANLGIAQQRAEKLAEKSTAHSDSEPYTGVVDLVKLLTTLKP